LHDGLSLRALHLGLAGLSDLGELARTEQLEQTMTVLSRFIARMRGREPYSRRGPLPRGKPAVPQPFDAAQMRLVLQLEEMHHGDRGRAALLLESFAMTGVFSAAQRSMIASLLSLGHDDLLRTLFDCASTGAARRVIGEELLRENVSLL
jgi:hypothetical protein